MRRLAPLSLLLAMLHPAGASAQNLNCDGYLSLIVVPDGFCVKVFAQDLPPVRNLVLHPSGTLVAALKNGDGLLAMEVGKDGKVGKMATFGPKMPGTGLTWGKDWLYFAADEALLRISWPAGRVLPDTMLEWLDRSLPLGRDGWAHRMKGVTLGPDGLPYVSFGSATDNCQVVDREANSPGIWPCPEMDSRAGIWRFSPGAPGTPWNKTRFATGLRNAEAIATDPVSGKIWAASHARDYLPKVWGWDIRDAETQPAEMLFNITANADYGWPYCMGFWSQAESKQVVAPEYSTQKVDCSSKQRPVLGFPGGWAPMAIAIPMPPLPLGLGRGMFMIFHGSRSRAPLPEDGHFVVFVPMDATGIPQKNYKIFMHTMDAVGTLRPTGMVVGPDGIMYVSDDEHGVIYRIEPHPPVKRP